MSKVSESNNKNIKRKKTSQLRKFYWYGLFLFVLSIAAYGAFYYLQNFVYQKQDIHSIKKVKAKNTKKNNKVKKHTEKKSVAMPEEKNIISELIGGDDSGGIALKTKKVDSKVELEKQKRDLLNLFDAYIDMLQNVNSGKVFIKEINLIRRYSHYNPEVGKLLDEIEQIAKHGVADNAKILLEIREITPDIYLKIAELERENKSKNIFKRFADSLLYIKSPNATKSSVEHIISKLEKQIGSDDYSGAEESIEKLLSMADLKKLRKIADNVKEKKKLSSTLKLLRKKLF